MNKYTLRLLGRNYGDLYVCRRRMRSNMGGNTFLKEGARVLQDRMSGIGTRTVYEEAPSIGSFTFKEMLVFNFYYG